AVWQNKADFDARFAQFAKDVQAAQAGITDEATFKQFAPAVFKNCGACHEIYKAKSG
ncbi:MAG: cytochrome c, partial [Hyphomicrobiales bacterium]|nr:cytochrome c [Hyphomicrobiales bacterium]